MAGGNADVGALLAVVVAASEAGAVFLFENAEKLNLGADDGGAVVVGAACGTANGLEVLPDAAWPVCLNGNMGFAED